MAGEGKVTDGDMGASEVIVAVLTNFQVMRTFGIVREYDIVVTSKGLLFYLKTGAWRLAARGGIPAGISAGLGADMTRWDGASYGAPVNSSLITFFETRMRPDDVNDSRRVSIKERVSKNRYNFYVPYEDIRESKIWKKWNALGGMTIWCTSGKIRCEFPLELTQHVKDLLEPKFKK